MYYCGTLTESVTTYSILSYLLERFNSRHLVSILVFATRLRV